jgi:hypothetical protein
MADKSRSSQNSRDLKTLKVCIVYGIHMKIIQLEIAVSLLIGVQETATREIRKKTTRKRRK